MSIKVSTVAAYDLLNREGLRFLHISFGMTETLFLRSYNFGRMILSCPENAVITQSDEARTMSRRGVEKK